jgi:hypothetical protein
MKRPKLAPKNELSFTAEINSATGAYTFGGILKDLAGWPEEFQFVSKEATGSEVWQAFSADNSFLGSVKRFALFEEKSPVATTLTVIKTTINTTNFNRGFQSISADLLLSPERRRGATVSEAEGDFDE